MMITMGDCRAAKMCSRGMRTFFKRHDMDWGKFLHEGIPEEEFIATGDAQALQLVEVARGRIK